MATAVSITGRLNAWAARGPGDATGVFELVYERLHEIAATHFAHYGGHRILQTTALINEAFLRLSRTPGICWQSREHFFAYSSRVMRHVLVDFAKEDRRLKRGAGAIHLTLEDPLLSAFDESSEDVIAIHQALEALEAIDPERSRIVELRYFGGMAPPEIAVALGMSESTVHRRWRLARAWLFRFLHGEA